MPGRACARRLLVNRTSRHSQKCGTSQRQRRAPSQPGAQPRTTEHRYRGLKARSIMTPAVNTGPHRCRTTPRPRPTPPFTAPSAPKPQTPLPSAHPIKHPPRHPDHHPDPATRRRCRVQPAPDAAAAKPLTLFARFFTTMTSSEFQSAYPTALGRTPFSVGGIPLSTAWTSQVPHRTHPCMQRVC